MAQNFTWPPGFSTPSPNASVGTNSAAIPSSSTLIGGKNPGGLLKPILTDTAGNLNVNVLSGFVPTAFDEIVLTYVPSGNGAGQIATATYKLATATVATLTMTYNGSDQLTDVLKS